MAKAKHFEEPNGLILDVEEEEIEGVDTDDSEELDAAEEEEKLENQDD